MNMLVETTGEVRLPVARRRWLAYSLRSLAILVTVAAILLAIFAQEIRERWFGPRLPYKVIQDVDDLHEALGAERSVVFFYVQWSIDAEHGRIRFHDFAREWQKRMPEYQARFYFLDCTDYDISVVEEVERLGHNAHNGSGELLWVCDGKPRKYNFGAGKYSLSELAGIAQQAFGLPSVAVFPDYPKVSNKSELWYWDDDEGYSSPSSPSESR